MSDPHTPIGRSDLPGEEPPQDLGALLQTAVGWSHRRFRTVATVDGLAYGAVSVLNRLRRAGPQSLADLARWEGVTAATMGQTVNRLLEGGFAVRETHPSDRRRVLICATDAGAAAAQRWVDAGTAWMDDALVGASEEDRTTLRRAAHLLIEIARS